MTISQTSGDYAGGVPPVPIPNTEVKTSRAEDTWGIAPGKVGHRQVNKQKAISNEIAFLWFALHGHGLKGESP